MQRSILQAKQDAQEQRAKSDWLTFRGPYVIIESLEDITIKNTSEDSQDTSTFSLDRKLARHIAGLISKRVDVDVDVTNGDITYVGIRQANENHPKFILVRFQQKEMRDAIWKKRKEAKKNGIIIEEWLTDNRYRLYKKCKELKLAKIIKDVITDDGDIYAVLLNTFKEISGTNDFNQEKQPTPITDDNKALEIKLEQKGTSTLMKDKTILHESANTNWIKKLVISDADYENLVKLTKSANGNLNEHIFT